MEPLFAHALATLEEPSFRELVRESAEFSARGVPLSHGNLAWLRSRVEFDNQIARLQADASARLEKPYHYLEDGTGHRFFAIGENL